ncbi:MAG: NAD(P)/FAD-dependent oxidoreductase [Aggregatilineales bacterium]
MSKTKNIAIIGAGITGMAAAWDLASAGHQVTLYEAGSEAGGLAAGFKDDGWDWHLEKFYHHWFETDKDILNLIEEIGHSDKLIFPRPKTSYWIDGKIVRSEISPSAIFLPVSLFSTIRMGITGVYLKTSPFWKWMEKYTCNDWMRTFMGDEAYEKFFQPLLIGKFGEYHDKVNMAWMWARIYKRSLKLGGFEGGFQNFLNLLAKAIEAKGATIHLNTPVEKIDLDGMQPTLTVNGETQQFDHIISTTSPKIMLKLTPRLQNTAYGESMKSLKSIGGLCVVLALKQQLLDDGTYWLNLPADTPDKDKNDFPFLALVEHTNYMDKAHYGGDHIIYCGDYVAPDHEYFSMSEDALVERFLPALKKVNPEFDVSWVRKSWVYRAPYAQPVPFVNHSENIPSLNTPLPGVIWASMSQVYPWDRGTNYSVEIGRRVAKMITGD